MSPILATQPGVEVDHDGAPQGAGACARPGPELRHLPGLHRAARGRHHPLRPFLSSPELLNIGQSVAFTGFAALGMLFVTTSGGFVDLSIPASMAASGIIALAFMPTIGVVGGVIAGIVAGMTSAP